MTFAFILRKNPVALMAALALLAMNVSATTIYDNSINDRTNRFNPGPNQIGDEIILFGPQRSLTNFSFEFWALNNGGVNLVGFGPVQARIRFYLNDGPLFNGYATPGFVFFDSGFFSIGGPTTRSTLVFSSAGGDFAPLGLAMPVVSNFTWTVQFQGMDGDDTAGVDIYDPPVVGQSLNDYWEFTAGAWSLKTNSFNMNFAALFQAVPEPSSVLLIFAGLGGAGLLAARRRLTKK